MDWIRFEQLGEAWGADVRRWPADVQPAARVLIATDPVRAERLLDAERQLDRLLAFAPDAAPSETLRAAALAQARAGEGQGPHPIWPAWVFARPALSGVAIAAACAGLLFGGFLGQGSLTSARQDALSNEIQTETVGAADVPDSGRRL